MCNTPRLRKKTFVGVLLYFLCCLLTKEFLWTVLSSYWKVFFLLNSERCTAMLSFPSTLALLGFLKRDLKLQYNWYPHEGIHVVLEKCLSWGWSKFMCCLIESRTGFALTWTVLQSFYCKWRTSLCADWAILSRYISLPEECGFFSPSRKGEMYTCIHTWVCVFNDCNHLSWEDGDGEDGKGRLVHWCQSILRGNMF